MSTNLHEILNLAKTLALKAGEEVVRLRNSDNLEITAKNITDIYTSADIASEKMIIEGITSKFPAHRILAEESRSQLEDSKELWGPVWIIDPIDGTGNFSRNIPHYAVSIAFADKGELKVGVVHSPTQRETFWATRGGGAFLNGQPIKTSGISELSKSMFVLGTGAPSRESTIDVITSRLRKALLSCWDIRRVGAASLDICWIACGRVEAFYEPILNTWDIAAANLIAMEAGARCGTLSNSIPTNMPAEFYAKEVFVATAEIYEKAKSLLIN